MVKARFLTILFTVLVLSCQSGRDHDKTISEFEPADSVIQEDPSVISDEVVWDIIYNFSSIVEIPAFMKDIGVPYYNGFISAADHIDNYDDNFRRAFLAGVLGSDIGYMNMYNRTADIPRYLTALRQLTDSLVPENIFDFNNMERLAGSESDQGSFTYSYMQSYNRMDEYLRQESMTHLSTAMVSGVWLEGLYLLTRASGLHPDNEIHERIGEQKIILNDLVIILRSHERSHPEFAGLTGQMSSIKEEFDQVEIVYEVDEPQAVERDGMLVIVQNQRSTVNIEDRQIENITRKAETIRNNLIL